jgi:hypothetical protein
MGRSALEQVVLSQITGTDELWDLILDNLQLEEIDELNSGYGVHNEIFWDHFTCPRKLSARYSPQLEYILATLLPENRGQHVMEGTALRQALELRGVEYEKLYGVKLEDVCIYTTPESLME